MVQADTTNLSWITRPPAASWDAMRAVRLARKRRSGDDLVPLGDLVAAIRQGVVIAEFYRGEIPITAARVADVQPVLLGAGERRFISASTLGRHVVEPGDVLMARVGRHGRASFIPADATPTVPREGLFAAKPRRREWGPAIAAALSTSFVKDWLDRLSVTSRAGALTKEQMEAIPVPSPRQFDYREVCDLATQAAALAGAGWAVLNSIRDDVSLLLENAPTETPFRRHLWLANVVAIPGWGWQNVQRQWVRARATWQVQGLKQLGEIVDLKTHQPKTLITGDRGAVLEADDIRPDWLLALPAARSAGAAAVRDQPSTLKRFFAVNRESLLIPTVGDIAGTPVVLPEVVFNGEAAPVLLPIHWLPLAGLVSPRALAVVLDHPFVRLQRGLAGSFSMVSHITREEIEELLVPDPPAAKWQEWESELRRAHDQLITATQAARRAIDIVEGWYS
jgi:hypothetical protein